MKFRLSIFRSIAEPTKTLPAKHAKVTKKDQSDFVFFAYFAGEKILKIAPPPLFFLILPAMVLGYLVAVEFMKHLFYRHYSVP